VPPQRACLDQLACPPSAQPPIYATRFPTRPPAAPRLPLPAVLGCTYYVVVAWIWALIWHMGLDPLKVRAWLPGRAGCVIFVFQECLRARMGGRLVRPLPASSQLDAGCLSSSCHPRRPVPPPSVPPACMHRLPCTACTACSGS
jgi:hypothetical protein